MATKKRKRTNVDYTREGFVRFHSYIREEYRRSLVSLAAKTQTHIMDLVDEAFTKFFKNK